MATIIWQTDFETGTPATIFNSVNGAPTIQTTYYNSGAKAFQSVGAATNSYGRVSYDPSKAIFIVRFYVHFSQIDADNYTNFCRIIGDTNSAYLDVFPSASGGYIAYYDAVAGDVASNVAPTTTPWYYIDLGFNRTSNKLDWAINGSEQTQLNIGTGPISAIDFGVLANVAMTIQYDDIALSVTAGDYPLGPLASEVSVTPAPAFIAGTGSQLSPTISGAALNVPTEINATGSQPAPTVAIIGPAVGAYVSPTIIMGW